MTKCYGTGCKKQMTCFRVIAPPKKFQSYFKKMPFKKDGSCSFYKDKSDNTGYELSGRLGKLKGKESRSDAISEYFLFLEKQAG